ncbi:MAG: DUF5011 domain-containing protein [Sulfurovum sp.]|nr:DUF5011 domain-containing protein [Sulfurovum sp.]
MNIQLFKETILFIMLLSLVTGCGNSTTSSNNYENNSMYETRESKSETMVLNGKNPMVLTEGEEYMDPGAIAIENGKKNENIIVAGDKVDTNNVGTYTVTYDMTDDAGNNIDTLTRTVIVDASTKDTPTITVADNKYASSKLQAMKDLLKEAKNGTKKVFFSVAGDSKRDDAVAQEEIFYSMWLKQVGVTYGHTAITSIESDAWITNSKGLEKLVSLSNRISTNGKNSIIGIELGTNDINHESIKNRDPQHLYDFTLSRLTTLIKTIKAKLPQAHIYLSEPALISQPKLKKVYQQLSVKFDIPLVSSVLDDRMSGNQARKWFKDDIHPLYSATARTMMNDFKVIMPKESLAVLKRYTAQNDFSSIPKNKRGVNLSQGIPVNQYNCLFDTEKTTSGKSITVPVIGGSIIKLVSDESILSNYHKALDANGKGIINNGDDFARSNVAFGSLRNAYKFIYVPKEAKSICFNYKIGSNINSNKLDVRYVSQEEMANHPTMTEIVRD